MRPTTIVALILAAWMLPFASAADAAAAVTFHTVETGAAEVIANTCPFGDWVPVVDTTCEGWGVLYFHEDVPPNQQSAPWRLFVGHDLVVVHPDGEGDVLFDTFGLVDDSQGSFDTKQLASASVEGTVPMSDGSTATIDLRWNMSGSPIETAGNDGPADQVAGIDPHYTDRCITLNQFAHQRFRRSGIIVGTIDGIDINAYHLGVNEPFMTGHSVFTYVSAQHGGCS